MVQWSSPTKMKLRPSLSLLVQELNSLPTNGEMIKPTDLLPYPSLVTRPPQMKKEEQEARQDLHVVPTKDFRRSSTKIKCIIALQVALLLCTLLVQLPVQSRLEEAVQQKLTLKGQGQAKAQTLCNIRNPLRMSHSSLRMCQHILIAVRD